ncbi:SDR family oxidoreductase [Chryseobacterium indoltheticum]|uniref:NAD(P)H azoreductase n=1 Tax=Chryseobacterium indoltheticum TaxID=254 RepID=A0A381FQY9_9FLAO|nr:NmrA family NAD(P)-binding protein [Chryseobacterium indoltheticum]SUX48797.1 NAD(P)H azoreductase [Chryseobacterium indoltheticum]
MKITITGSLGNIGRPLTKDLILKGHEVTVISTDAKKESAINALGAKAAIGSVEDTAFLTSAFSGADAVYLMEPPLDFFDKALDIEAYYGKLGRNFVKAILNSGVKHVVHLSSIGAHTNEGNGMLHFHHLVENILRELPSDISLTHVRALAIYYNLQSFVPGIKHAGKITANYGGDDVIAWVSPSDVADAAAEELESPGLGRKFRYVVSDELTCNETASILGKAIGIPDLKWEVISDEQQLARLVSIGMAPNQAAGLTEMNAAMHTGKLFEDYRQHSPAAFGKVKMSDYADEFAKAYHA